LLFCFKTPDFVYHFVNIVHVLGGTEGGSGYMMRGRSRRYLAGIASAVVVFSIAAVAWAAYGGPATVTHFTGNLVSCTDLGYNTAGTFDANGGSGTFNTDHNGNPSFSVTVVNHGGDPMTFDWFSATPVAKVIVKVGNGGTIYSYAPPVTGDVGLESQDSSGAGKASISHLLFCSDGTPPAAVKLLSFSAKASRTGVHVSWKTASEVGALGFNVYRQVGTVKVKLNAKLIAAKGGTGGASYSLVDRSGKSSSRYLLQEIQKNGASKLVARATAAS
jgi:hypothetical protein